MKIIKCSDKNNEELKCLMCRKGVGKKFLPIELKFYAYGKCGTCFLTCKHCSHKLDFYVMCPKCEKGHPIYVYEVNAK